jgi:EAL domain-containing protein (putative c-di-GMP-specific phosphodiesterase class I)
LKAIQSPFHIDKHTVILDVHMGVTTSCISRVDGAGLLRHADIALTQTPGEPGRQFSMFALELEADIKARQTLDLALRRALRENEFYLLFQPQIDLVTHEVIGVEALVRWKNGAMGTVSPADFIPLAEETGLIVALGEWVLQDACKQIAACDWQGRLSVNVSAVQFELSDVVAMVAKALTASGLDPRRLDLEITESLFVGNNSSIHQTLDALRTMGIGVAMDDFGTGYSSLSYLARLPIDKLKIDQSFVRALPQPDSLAIVETIIALAHRLKKTIIAEGIETEEQRLILTNLDCEVGQGYLFNKPVPLVELGISRAAA